MENLEWDQGARLKTPNESYLFVVHERIGRKRTTHKLFSCNVIVHVTISKLRFYYNFEHAFLVTDESIKGICYKITYFFKKIRIFNY